MYIPVYVHYFCLAYYSPIPGNCCKSSSYESSEKLFINVITGNIKVDEKARIDNFTNLTKKVDFKFCELNKFFVLCCREVCGAKWCGLLKKNNISLQNKLIHQKTKKSYG